MLSSWGSSNYRPSAPFLYEVASHVKKLPFRRLLLLLLLCGADLLFRADNFVNQIVGVVRIRRDTTVASDWLMWIVAGKGVLQITRGMAGCMHARHQRMHACALCRMQRDTRTHTRETCTIDGPHTLWTTTSAFIVEMDTGAIVV